MFYIKYQRTVLPSDHDDDELIPEVLPMEIRRGDGTPINHHEYNIRVNPRFEGPAILGIDSRMYGPVKYHEVNVDLDCGYV
jgi:hypothetical protein